MGLNTIERERERDYPGTVYLIPVIFFLSVFLKWRELMRGEHTQMHVRKPLNKWMGRHVEKTIKSASVILFCFWQNIICFLILDYNPSMLLHELLKQLFINIHHLGNYRQTLSQHIHNSLGLTCQKKKKKSLAHSDLQHPCQVLRHHFPSTRAANEKLIIRDGVIKGLISDWTVQTSTLANL